ncbi:MAG: hypothetical protein Q7J82_06600 [Coriobacteriia bacterium]|nr:hypothetical protein [Coriobacteriia bacterium]
MSSCRASGLAPWCPLENLGHTSLVRANENGVSWEDAASWAGHSSPKMLRTRYVKRRLLLDALAHGGELRVSHEVGADELLKRLLRVWLVEAKRAHP